MLKKPTLLFECSFKSGIVISSQRLKAFAESSKPLGMIEHLTLMDPEPVCLFSSWISLCLRLTPLTAGMTRQSIASKVSYDSSSPLNHRPSPKNFVSLALTHFLEPPLFTLSQLR